MENRGAGAPTLDITDPFGETMYQVAAGQHVLFEHGSLHEVVDHEREPCGCPEVQQGMSVADALLASGGGKKASIAGVKAAGEHPFPAAVSEGLAPAAEVPQAAVGVTHMQIADTLSYSAAGSEAAAAGRDEQLRLRCLAAALLCGMIRCMWWVGSSSGCLVGSGAFVLRRAREE